MSMFQAKKAHETRQSDYQQSPLLSPVSIPGSPAIRAQLDGKRPTEQDNEVVSIFMLNCSNLRPLTGGITRRTSPKGRAGAAAPCHVCGFMGKFIPVSDIPA